MPMIGAFQFSIEEGNVEKNLVKVEGAIKEAHKLGIRLLVLPEMWNCGFDYKNLKHHARKAPEIVERMVKWSKNSELILIGSIPEITKKGLVNCSYIVDSSVGVVGRYEKIHLFSPYGEHLHFKRGNRFVVCKTSLCKVGLIICYDLRFPELCRKIALAGAEILCVSALWPKARVEHWRLLLRARAIENQLFVIGCNGCGTIHGKEYPGTSAIINPWGEVVAEGGAKEEIIYGDFDISLIEKTRKAIPCFSDRRSRIGFNPCP